MLAESLGENFRPYAVEQVHDTIMGLEGTRVAGGVRSEKMWRLRHEEKLFNFSGMLNFLRREFTGFDVQIGGFCKDSDYGFLSQGQHPFARSFRIHEQSVVAMGWPREGTNFPLVLDALRRALQRFGALRKWAWEEGGVDNDFYFVVGKLARRINDEERERTQHAVRKHLAAKAPLMLRVDRTALLFVAYSDLELTPGDSRVLRLTDSATTAEAFAAIYTAQ